LLPIKHWETHNQTQHYVSELHHDFLRS